MHVPCKSVSFLCDRQFFSCGGIFFYLVIHNCKLKIFLLISFIRFLYSVISLKEIILTRISPPFEFIDCKSTVKYLVKNSYNADFSPLKLKQFLSFKFSIAILLISSLEIVFFNSLRNTSISVFFLNHFIVLKVVWNDLL